MTLLSTSLASNREKRVLDQAQAKNDAIATRSKTAPSRSKEKTLTIKEPSIPPPPSKDSSRSKDSSKKAQKRPMDGSSKEGRQEKKSKTSAQAASQELVLASTVHPDASIAVTSSTEVLADLLRVEQGNLPNMSSSSIGDQISAGWAYALKALACVQRNYDMLGQSSTSARESAERASEKLLSAEKRIKYLEEVRGEMKTEASTLKRSVSVLEGQVATRDAEIGTLRRQMDSLRSSWDAELRLEVSNALRELHAKASGKMAAAKERLLVLKRDFINPCLASAEVVDPEADSALTSELIGIARLLRLSPLPSPSVEDGMKGSSLELLSAEVGVTAQAGSNLYSSVVDALLAEKRCEEVIGAGTSAEARQNEEGPTEVVEVPASLEGPKEVVEAPASQENVEEVARGEQSLPSQEGTLPPIANEAGDVAETQKEPEKVPADVAPTSVEVQDGEQAVDPSAEVKTPPAKQTPSVEEGKNSSGPSDIWDQIVL